MSDVTTVTNHRTGIDFLDVRAALLRMSDDALVNVWGSVSDQASEMFDLYWSALDHYGPDHGITKHYKTRWHGLRDLAAELDHALKVRGAV